MIDLKLTYYSYQLPKWLGTVILFFSTLFFSDYTSSSKSLYQQNARTELVYLNNSKASRGTVCYKKSPVSAYKNKFFYSSLKYKISTLLLHNRLTKVKFDTISKKSCSIRITGRFFQIKKIPQSPTGDNLTSAIG
jgi:hypothetical protein